ncbi:MAG: cold shock domain-containing protein [Alphaproteobacteria bacterium]|nr:MAG: cold shock domain-containing protein [Alphaproteobacteria bacterium]
MTEDGAHPPPIRGRVKWFDPSKGFGFVVPEGGGSDVLLHANVLRNFGQGSVAEGALIEMRVQQTPRGLQAVAVLSIELPQGEGGGLPASELPPGAAVELSALPLEPARVKWFDKVKGFGFANVFAQPGDVFIHMEVVRRSGLADLSPGEAVVLRVVEGRRGRMAAQVLSWESALPGARAP